MNRPTACEQKYTRVRTLLEETTSVYTLAELFDYSVRHFSSVQYVFRLFACICNRYNALVFHAWPTLEVYQRKHKRYLKSDSWVYDLVRNQCVASTKDNAETTVATVDDFEGGVIPTSDGFAKIIHPIPPLVCDIPDVGRIHANGTTFNIEKVDVNMYGMYYKKQGEIFPMTGFFPSQEGLLRLFQSMSQQSRHGGIGAIYLIKDVQCV